MPFNENWVARARRIAGRKWDAPNKKWMIPMDDDTVASLCHHFDGIPVEIEDRELKDAFPELMKLRDAYELQSLNNLSSLLKQKGYSTSTQRAYLGHAHRFLNGMKDSIENVTTDHIRRYVVQLVNEDRSHVYINQAISTLRFWVCEVERKSGFRHCWVRPKRQKKLPTVLSQVK